MQVFREAYFCTFCERTRIIGDSSDVKTAVKICLQASLMLIFTVVFTLSEQVR